MGNSLGIYRIYTYAHGRVALLHLERCTLHTGELHMVYSMTSMS